MNICPPKILLELNLVTFLDYHVTMIQSLHFLRTLTYKPGHFSIFSIFNSLRRKYRVLPDASSGLEQSSASSHFRENKALWQESFKTL